MKVRGLRAAGGLVSEILEQLLSALPFKCNANDPLLFLQVGLDLLDFAEKDELHFFAAEYEAQWIVHGLNSIILICAGLEQRSFTSGQHSLNPNELRHPNENRVSCELLL